MSSRSWGEQHNGRAFEADECEVMGFCDTPTSRRRQMLESSERKTLSVSLELWLCCGCVDVDVGVERVPRR